MRRILAQPAKRRNRGKRQNGNGAECEIDRPVSLGYTRRMLVIRHQCSTLFLPRIASWDATL
jgi:hypothetical protein